MRTQVSLYTVERETRANFNDENQNLTFVFPFPVKHRILDPEGLALGAVIASSKKAKRDLIDNSFNR